MFYKTTISYKGTHYSGWQSQPHNPDINCIEDEFKQAIAKIADYGKYSLQVAGRTDAGVHALGQVLKIGLPFDLDNVKLMSGLNSLLPSDIRVQACLKCHDSFNPNRAIKIKEYRYQILTGEVPSPLLDELALHCPGLVNWDKVKWGLKLIQGEHDFVNFSAAQSDIQSTIRVISKTGLCEQLVFDQKVYQFIFQGKGFLKHMLRYLMGGLISLGRNEISEEEFTKALSGSIRKKISPKCKAKGLILYGIKFD